MKSSKRYEENVCYEQLYNKFNYINYDIMPTLDGFARPCVKQICLEQKMLVLFFYLKNFE